MVNVPAEEDFILLAARVEKIEQLIETLKATIDSLYALLHPT